jgi:hypothetical protein
MTTARRLDVGALALLASLALAASAAAPATAASPPAPKPPTLALSAGGGSGANHLRGRPGRVLHGAVTVSNVSRRRITVRLQPADIRNATNGNADYSTNRLSQAGRWLRLSTRTVHLAPKSSRRIAYSVRIPHSARGASHYAGIVAVNAAELAAAKSPGKLAKSGAGFTIARINRQALPITIRLPGPLTRKLTLRSVKLDVSAAGAGLVLGLLPRGTVLMQDAKVKLRVSRGSKTILRNASALGQLIPDSRLDYRIAWNGRPTEGVYLVRGVIRPKGAAPVYINQTIGFTAAKVKELKRETPPVAQVALSKDAGLPMWVWLALAGGGALLLSLSLAVWRLARRGRRTDEAPAPAPLRALPDPREQDDRHDRTAA